MAQLAERISFDRFDYGVLLGPSNGIDVYASQVIPPYLRNLDYDQQLVSGAALLPGEQQFDPYSLDADEYKTRRQRLSGMRVRIEGNTDFTVRTLLGEGALRQILGSEESLSPEELAERQGAVVESIRTDVESGKYSVRIVPVTADTRAVSTGDFSIVNYTDRPAELVKPLRRDNFVEAREGDGSGGVERARLAFNKLWSQTRQTVTAPDTVAAYLGNLADGLRMQNNSSVELWDERPELH